MIMALFVAKCTHCQKDITLDDQWDGLDVNCPLCNGVVTVHKPAAGAPVQGSGSPAGRTPLRIKQVEPTAGKAAPGTFWFECPHCKTRALLPEHAAELTYICEVCRTQSKAGIFAEGKNKLHQYSRGANERVSKFSSSDIFKDLKSFIIIAVIMVVVGVPVYLVCEYSSAMDTTKNKPAGSSNASENAARKFIPKEIDSGNNAKKMKDRSEAINKFASDEYTWKQKMEILNNLLERYPDLKRDAELLDWKDRIEEKI